MSDRFEGTTRVSYTRATGLIISSQMIAPGGTLQREGGQLVRNMTSGPIPVSMLEALSGTGDLPASVTLDVADRLERLGLER